MAWKNVQYENGKLRTSEGGGGGSSTLAGLEDVDLTNPSDGQIIKWDATNQKWVNANESGGSFSMTKIAEYTLTPSLVRNISNVILSLPSGTLSEGYYFIGFTDRYSRDGDTQTHCGMNGESGKVVFPASGSNTFSNYRYDRWGWGIFAQSIIMQVIDSSSVINFTLYGYGYNPTNVVITIYKIG